ncbi:YebC/PmpR family DNA-binding transcriptional regulator [Waterburya agarophytonicola K14]|uniref:Probable transcriptional regulatory protein I4641_22685 n=1 Tax=Waterburya agarophytonicola KI4 TaxID=2874699 RepID=A0A964BXB3_9CYAN|nr:YebC/PmpR family DNA-binding transcriptional regulator [Waterburya agarophytonicola KI4]
MAGHSKWANIKRQKARVDAKKGKTFTQLSRAIIVAARNGVADPDGNFQLRTAIDKAKAAGVSNESIERSLAKGAGTYQDDDAILEEIRYEGYGAGGVAILIEALTDNRNRTAAYLRSAFTKNDGNLGEIGCVSWMFEQKGVITLDVVDEEKLLEASLEGEADSYEMYEEEGAEVFTSVTNLEHLNQTLQKHDFPIQEIELRWIPNNNIEITDSEQERSLFKLIDTLESLDDVQNVTANFLTV